MIGDRHPPADWPIDRNLTPTPSHPLSGDDARLLWRLGDLQTFLRTYDMTLEEAITCLQHELDHYETTPTLHPDWSYCPRCGSELDDSVSPDRTECPQCDDIYLTFTESGDTNKDTEPATMPSQP